MVKSFDDLVSWIKAECTPDDYGSPTAEDAAKWFVAMKMAEEWREWNTLKEMAHLIIRGMGPLTPDECTQWILEHVYDEDGDVENSHDINMEHWKFFEEDLNGFFFGPFVKDPNLDPG